ncbi:IS66 family insertion sequence element accessory protein TnpB [Paenibacillus algorifonticola]|uniref:IS66 family insertion sequence element accessory protein TnpB n=1 Tax=Paenibacillus algorifonticola TaxID=684063 RepID=UPI0009431F0B
MLTLSSHTSVYLAAGATDLRRSIDGLAALVQEGFGLDPFSPCLFVFCNPAHNDRQQPK